MTDIPANPSSLVVNGAIVNAANPLPCKSVPAGSGSADVVINPRTLVVNGALVTTLNPLPITLE